MSVGPVVRTSAQGLPEVVRRGSSIMPGDRLDTADGGHLHIKFIDGAMVSIRPGSRLWVQDYRYDPEHVALSLVRFKLEYGVARAISGAAAEGARERFRLNTPLVAIGVRGTDFVVRSGEHATTAAVNQGAIIMAPFGEGC
ncbi:MAG TPA: FecR family protein, partial [Ramlibacter sp.]|nr:FecR family protein [Ramlibacter sp.]